MVSAGRGRYGFETAVKAFHGLDQRSMDEYFEFMQANKFNALRVPFSLKFALNFDEAVRGTFCTAMPRPAFGYFLRPTGDYWRRGLSICFSLRLVAPLRAPRHPPAVPCSVHPPCPLC